MVNQCCFHLYPEESDQTKQEREETCNRILSRLVIDLNMDVELAVLNQQIKQHCEWTEGETQEQRKWKIENIECMSNSIPNLINQTKEEKIETLVQYFSEKNNLVARECTISLLEQNTGRSFDRLVEKSMRKSMEYAQAMKKIKEKSRKKMSESTGLSVGKFLEKDKIQAELMEELLLERINKTKIKETEKALLLKSEEEALSHKKRKEFNKKNQHLTPNATYEEAVYSEAHYSGCQGKTKTITAQPHSANRSIKEPFYFGQVIETQPSSGLVASLENAKVTEQEATEEDIEECRSMLKRAAIPQ